MQLQNSKLLIKSLSNNTTKATQNWRTKIKDTNLISQISSILLQRHNWPSLLQTLNLKSKLTQSIFLQILNTTKNQPQISLDFFKWSIKNTSFQPNLYIQCKMTHLLISHGFVNHSKPILDSLLKNNPPDQVVKFVNKSCEKDLNFNSSRKCLEVFDCVICWYCENGLCLKGLEVFNLVKCLDGNELFSVGVCNTLLNSLQENDEVELGLCFFGVVIRHGVLIDRFTWRVIARLLGKQGKVDGMIRIIDMGIHDLVIYDLVIECCSEMGMFEVALQMFDEMSRRKLSPGFNTFASILNGACRYNNHEMIKFAMESMVEKGYVSKTLTGHDLLIQKLCDIRKTYAAHRLFKTTCEVQSLLESETYGCMLRALSMDARVEDAIETYHFIEERRIQVNSSFYNEFINILCNEDPSKEVTSLLVNMISSGYKPSPMALSKYIISQCKKRRWQESEELANLALQESICLEASCCGCLVKHYCNTGHIELAIKMHDQLEKKELTLDSKTYNALLTGLLQVPMLKEAERIFDYMRIKNLLDSESFVIMINGFCHDELKKAMKLHDEMLETGLKPSTKMYKRLICNFR